jgi:general secretion pathway protein C
MGVQALLKRHFWVVGAASVLLCAVFGARIVNALIEAKYLSDSEVAPKLAPLASAAGAGAGLGNTSSGSLQVSKNGKALEERNMFCSTCVPAAPVVETPAAVAASDGTVPLTTLTLQLVATSVSTDLKSSFATVINTTTLKQGGFFIGDPLPGAGPIRAIRALSIDFENPGAGNRLERISLLGEAPAAAAPSTPTTVAAAPPVDTGPKDELTAAVEAGIKKTGENTYEVARSLVDQALGNPMAFQKGARVVASVKNGKPDGIKMYAIKPSSAYAKLGFSNGDTLHSVNGLSLGSLENGLEMVTKLREVNQLQIEVTRRGKPVTLNYTIR